MFRFLRSWRPGTDAAPSAPALPPDEPAALPPGFRVIDVEGMIRQASTRVSIDQLVRKGKKFIHLLSREKIDELINRSVRTIVDKHRLAADHRHAATAAQMEAESRAEFEELLHQYQQAADVANAVELSKQALELEFEEVRFELDPVQAPEPVRPEPAASAGDAREVAILRKRMEKLGAYVATLEAALKTLSAAKTFSNQQVQNLLRDLGLAQDDKNFEKKKEMLKVVLHTNQGIRRKARELAARGITLDAPEEKAVFTSSDSSGSSVFSRSSV